MMKVEPITFEEAKPWILKKHYAHRMPCVQYSFGLFSDKELIGLCIFGIPASPHLCRGICGESFSNLVLELNRVVLDGCENSASFLISRAVKLLPRPKILISYADNGVGRVGYIYQAANWIYTGITDYGRKTPRADRLVKNKHGRHCTDKNIDLVYRSKKYRYIYFIGSKKQKKEMLAALKYPILPYPKGETIRYDATSDFMTQKRLF